jgi:membrane protease YdiL (CAAX protease family)
MSDPRDASLPALLAIVAVGLGLVLMSLVVFAAQPALGLRPALLLGQLSLVAPLLTAIRAFGLHPPAALGLRAVPARGLVLGAAAGSALWLASAGLLSLQYVVWPPRPEILRFFESLHAELDLWPPWSGAFSLLAIAVGPAVSEELAFRGAVLESVRRRLGDPPAVLVSAVLFGLIHYPPGGYRIPFALALGLGLGAMRLRTGSILPGIAAHAVLNATTVLVATQLGAQAKATEAAPPAAGAALLAFGAVIATLFVLAIPRAMSAQRGTLGE